ncbi:hypothetical protein NQZ68_025645 [Dissostichus eleginoides]|nr:hypothetical protein NQZ68_025645 [Dissostichus eleginoides]
MKERIYPQSSPPFIRPPLSSGVLSEQLRNIFSLIKLLLRALLSLPSLDLSTLRALSFACPLAQAGLVPPGPPGH